MSTTIESLELEILSNSQSAENGIDALSQSLTKLKDATKGGLGLSAVAKQISSISTAINSINPTSLSNLTNLSNAIRSLSGVKISPTIGTSITSITNSLNNMKIDSSASAKIKELVSTLEPLSKLPKSNLSSYVTSLKNLPKVLNDLNKLDMGAVRAKIVQLTDALKPLATEMEKISAGASALPSKIQQLISGNNKLANSNGKVKSSFTDIYYAVRTVITSIVKVVKSIYFFIQKSSDYVENLNLFTVSMGEYANEAKEFAETVGNAMGIDPGEWMRAQGVFMTISTGFGIAGDRAATMSKNLTQLGYDLSSFYNISVENAMDKLKSGLAGELEPLRAIGYDLSQAKLEATALALGIDKSVSSMTQAEKAQLRYYAIMTQVTTAQGDMARTLNDPANQMRVLKAQANVTAREIGNMFIPALNAVLPVATAVTRVIGSLASILAGLFGYEAPDLSESTGKVVTNTDAIAENIETGKEEAKKLKSYMLGFDELNIINPNTDNGLGDTSEMFNFELPEYDFMGSLVENKVDGIVKKMKEWLGITDEITSWAELLNTRLGKILVTVGLIAAAFALIKIVAGFAKIIETISSLFGKKDDDVGETGGSKGITSPKTILKGLANVAIIVGGVIALVGVVGLLTKIPGFNVVMHDGLSALGTVFTGLLPVLIPISLVSVGMALIGKIQVSQVAKGMANMAIIIGGTVGVITAIGALISIPYFNDFISTGIISVTKTFNGLYDIAIPIGVLSAYMGVIGLISPSKMAQGLAGFAIVIGGATVLVTAIGALMTIPEFSDFLSTGITSVQNLFNGLYDVALPIGVLSGLLVALGIATPTLILSGLAGFALVIGGFSIVLTALGALKQIPGFAWIVNEGGDMLATLGNVLGKFAGSIVGGFGEGISDSFPKIGENLASFMENATPFFEGLEKVNSKSLTAVKNLGTMFLTLTAADIIDGLTNWFTGGNTLGKFGKDLRAFAPDFVAFAKEIEGIDASVVEASSIAAQSIVEFANNIPNEGGVAAWFAGENSIDVFGDKLPSFGANLKKYSDNIKGLDGDAVVNSMNAARSIVEIADNIPNEGGVAAWFTGDNAIDVFGGKLPGFGKNIKQYSDNIKGLDNAAVTNSSVAAKSIVALCKEIPNSGGVASWFTGDNDIADFGEKLANFGVKFSAYYDTIKGINPTTLNNITDRIGKIIDFAIRVKNDVDIRKVNDFTDALNDLGKAIRNLPTSKSITITVNQVMNNVDSVADAISAGLPLFASGGFPESGQAFIARENGLPEMVGTIGRRTAVANNDQIVESVASGVAEANGEQNMLLREQNSLLRALLEKDSGVYLDGRSLSDSVDKYKREQGRVIIAGGVL